MVVEVRHSIRVAVWAAILAQRVQLIDPHPSPWLQAQALGSEAVAMLQAVKSISDANQRTRLLTEVAERLLAAGKALKEEAAR